MVGRIIFAANSPIFLKICGEEEGVSGNFKVLCFASKRKKLITCYSQIEYF